MELADLVSLSQIDTSLESTEMLVLECGDETFALKQLTLDAPRRKEYGAVGSDDISTRGDCTLVAVVDGHSVAVAIGILDAWNRTLRLEHLYVDAAARGRGAGRALLAALEAFARMSECRCLRVETQNVNVPAIRFYQACGLAICGPDADLYDPDQVDPTEFAIFLTRRIRA